MRDTEDIINHLLENEPKNGGAYFRAGRGIVHDLHETAPLVPLDSLEPTTLRAKLDSFHTFSKDIEYIVGSLQQKYVQDL